MAENPSNGSIGLDGFILTLFLSVAIPRLGVSND